MTLLDSIGMANTLRPNAIEESIKARWVFELEAAVAELMEVPLPENPYPNDIELLMPFPKDSIYHLYLCAMIDSTIEDTSLYVNDMTIANNAKDDAFKWWRRYHKKSCGQYIRTYSWQPPVGGSEESPVYGAVTSVNGMTGDVELTANDIPFESSDMYSTRVGSAIEEVNFKRPAGAIEISRQEYLSNKDYYDSLDNFIIVEKDNASG